ncbi:hypothetical protein KSF_011400 [Reticulibacter mediterranei]|uniref:Uncharacterized protein n=1 Tax=Reticulibacter mediterranei TaxID=2778369 RepID=A0A8J3IGI7_9CHLR|nr:hypothetical protein [Reticulibacter mediterranei]GHO91092.1 hypothetical protein KSF_011400 [Reticulibacter mediterranei]
MQKQPVTIKVWCREADLYRTADLLSWAVGHRVEIPPVSTGMINTYFFIITDIKQYEDEDTIRKTMGFDIIGKISGVIDWEIMLKENASARPILPENDKIDRTLMAVLDDLPIPLSIVARSDGSYTWKWQNASGQNPTFMGAVKAALTHVMHAYTFIRNELVR